MDENGTKVLSKKLPPLPPNRIFPKEIDNEVARPEGGLQSEVPYINEIQETQRSDKGPSVNETVPLNQPSFEKTIEGKVSAGYIVLDQQQLSVYKGDSKEGELLHQYAFPHGAEYRFSSYHGILYIYDENGQEIQLRIGEKQLLNDIWMQWLSTTRFFTDFKRESAGYNATDDFCEQNYALKFNLPSIKELANIYNEQFMTFFKYYPIAEGLPYIKNAVEFQHFYRPNLLKASYEQECDQKIEEHMNNRDRQFIQWAPSRDWSRLFVLSMNKSDDFTFTFLELYNFNNEKQINLPSPLRMNFLSQHLRPQWIKNLQDPIPESLGSQMKIEASFTGDTIIIRKVNSVFYIIYLNPDLTHKKTKYFTIKDASIESLTLSCSNLYVKSNEVYYEQSVSYIDNKFKTSHLYAYNHLSLEIDFIKIITLKNIIKSGIYDILIFDQHIKIFNNINPLNQLNEIVVDNDILKLLQSNNFIQLDHHQIACISQPLIDKQIHYGLENISSMLTTTKYKAIPIILTIQQDKLVKQECIKILLKSPWNPQPSDCLFNLVKFKQNHYAVLIVSSVSKNETFYQYYRVNQYYVFEFQKKLNDYKDLQQIPHLPLFNINGSQFINCDHYTNNYQLELDLRLDEQEILNLDQENINFQQVKVYTPNFKEYLFRFIEEKEKIFDKQTGSEIEFISIEIPQLRTSIIIKSGGQNSGVLIFQHSIEKIKYLRMKQAILYKTHNVIYRDSSYNVSIILQIDNALYEMRMCFDLAKLTLTPFQFIMNLPETQNLHEIYLNDDFTVSLFFPEQDCCFQHFSLDPQKEQEEPIKIDFKNLKSQNLIPYLTSFIKRIAHSKSIRIGNLLKENFNSIIFKNAEESNKKDLTANVFSFQNKMMLISGNSIEIMDDSFNEIANVNLSSKFGISMIRIAYSIDSEALECIDELNNKFPMPILWNFKDYKSQNVRLNNYSKNFRYPIPFQFGFLDGFISHIDLMNEKLLFYKSKKDLKDGNVSARIEVIARRESFMDEIIKFTERKQIEDKMKNIKINDLLSYNVNKTMNLITATKDHAEKDHIYNVLYKMLEIAEIKELPMLIYNTSVEPNKYESILDILVKNKAFKLALLIVSIAIKQDQIGYVYSRLYQYLSIFSANELQMFFENQIFFFKIPQDRFKEYQIVKNTLIKPLSNHKTFSQICENMKNVESQVLQIEESEATTEIKDSDQPLMENKGENQIEEDKFRVEEIKDSDIPEKGKERDKLQISEIDFEEKENSVPTEYFAINLMNLIQSKHQSLNKNHENHREVTKMLNKIVEIDESIIEKESFQIIVDFKWDSYAQKFFSVQLGLFICFIISFILDVVAVNKNSHVFSSDDQNQVIPRIISIAILIPFAIYEIANIVVTRKTYFQSFWNFIDMILIALYVTYFTTTFARPEQKDILKSLQLLIVILSFIKFSFLIRIWTQVSFLVRMLLDVFKELRIFLFFFLLVIGCLTVMAYIIMVDSGEAYNGIKSVAYFVIILRQALGDTDTSSIIDGSKEFQILAWLLWLLILIIGNVVFMNFIIAVVSESYEGCMERKLLLIYKAKLEMITECEDLMPEWFFTNQNWFPRFIIIRREQGSSEGGDSSDEWYGFVKQMQKHLQHETNKLNDMFIQNINRSTESTKKEVKTGLEKVAVDGAEVKKDVAEVKKDVAEIKTAQEEQKDQINEIKLILSAVFKDQIAIIKAKEAQANDNKAI